MTTRFTDPPYKVCAWCGFEHYRDESYYCSTECEKEHEEKALG